MCVPKTQCNTTPLFKEVEIQTSGKKQKLDFNLHICWQSQNCTGNLNCRLLCQHQAVEAWLHIRLRSSRLSLLLSTVTAGMCAAPSQHEHLWWLIGRVNGLSLNQLRAALCHHNAVMIYDGWWVTTEDLWSNMVLKARNTDNQGDFKHHCVTGIPAEVD